MRRADSLGRLAVGCHADLALLDLDTVSFTPLNDLRRQLVYCEDGSSVRATIVAGRVVYRAGPHHRRSTKPRCAPRCAN